MESYSESLTFLLSDIQNILPSLVGETSRKFMQLESCLDGINSLVVYGNDSVFLDAYVDLCLQKHYGVDKLNKRHTETHVVSDHHFEFDFSTEFFSDNIESIKKLSKTKSITCKPHIVYIKKVNRNKCKSLHGLVDNTNIIFIISTPKLFDIDDNIDSRSLKINLAFSKQNIILFLESKLSRLLKSMEMFDEAYTLTKGNLIGIILRLECENNIYFETSFYRFLEGLEKTRSFLTLVNNIRDMIYKIYHINAQFPYVSSLVINRFKDNPKLCDVVQCCAKYDHMMNNAYKDIFVMEKFFLDIVEIVKNKDDVVVKRGRKKVT